MFTVAALYQFAPIEDIESVQKDLQSVCDNNDICGTLLVASEGINGTIAGSREGIDTVVTKIRSLPGFETLEYKESHAETAPFHRMRVRLKKEIVTIGNPDIDPNETVGTYVAPEEWNDIISDPDTIIIDTRNHYEVEIGTFKNAVNPKTESFREFPRWVQENITDKKKKIAMFCTGGIRCEKASSYMKQEGFDEVYHLKGGILKYLETVPEDKSLWDGDCFVFDQRVAVTHGLELCDYAQCPSCRRPVTPEQQQSKKYIEGVTCPGCYDSLSEDRKARSAERQKQMTLAVERGEKHIGAEYD